MKFVWILLLSMSGVGAPSIGIADTLNTLVEARMKKIDGVSNPIKMEKSYAFEGWVPWQNFEYQYGIDNYENNFNPGKDDERHTLRLNFKSPTEMQTFKPSRRISEELLRTSELENINQSRFDAYMSIVQQVVYYRMVKLFGSREKDLNKSVEQSSQLLGLPKINVRDLINELNRLHKVSSEGRAVEAQANAFKDMKLSELDSAADALIQHMSLLGQRIGELPKDQPALAIQRKQLELDLTRINREVSWADDHKLVSHIALGHDPDQNENTFRINFNIPWIRFDRETYSRERVLHKIDEQNFAREASKIKSELERKRYEIQGLAAQGESTRERLVKAKAMVSKVKKVKDVELRRVLDDFGFELERDVLVIVLKFYTEYLEYLYEEGHFARHGDANLLDPKWVDLVKAGG